MSRQPTIRTPLAPFLLDQAISLGMVGVRSRVMLHLVSDGRTEPTAVEFVIDSGASYSVVSLELARRLRFADLPPPEAEIDLTIRTARGFDAIRVRPGRIRLWWNPEQSGYWFDWPVLFRVDAPPAVPPLLGLGGIIKTCRWTFDGESSFEASYGTLLLEDMR